jgi:hypothetical protein
MGLLIEVKSVAFSQFDGTSFERLAFAYLLRAIPQPQRIDWYGQLGGDSGWDIWLVTATGEHHCYQCANHQRLHFDKARQDIAKVLAGPDGIPHAFILIVGGKVSAKMKARIETYIQGCGVKDVQVWSGAEFEERIRRDAADLLERFCNGVSFPETAQALKAFASDSEKVADADILSRLAECFDRPAFTTPFRQESNLPDFKQAITDTIEAINTGIRRLRDGTEIDRGPSRHRLKSPEIKSKLGAVVGKLVELRAAYDQLIQTGRIRLCGCGKADCPTHMIDDEAAIVMDDLRAEIFVAFRDIWPGFEPPMISVRFARFGHYRT